MRRVLLLVPVAILFAVGCAPVPPGGSPDPGPTTPPGTTTWTDEMVALVNQERANEGVAPLQVCTTLMTAAQRHSDDQAATGRMSHTGSNGSTMSQRVQAAGYTGWTALAENVAAGQPDVASVVGAWMDSAGHRTNLLSANYHHIGLGRASGSGGTLYWTQNFGRSGAC
ncbi:MAG: CAP domain-containing protein [Microthrixaceae bacterium]